MQTKGNKAIGDLGEKLAGIFMLGRGHAVLDTNWRTGHLEIDLITLAPDGLHIIEVKTRVAPVSSEPQDSVGIAKQRRLVTAAQRWLQEKDNGKIGEMEVHFDIIAITLDRGGKSVEYFPDAFLPCFR